VARCPAKVKDYKRGTAQKIVTRCIKIGEVVRKAKETGTDPKEAFVKVSGAVELFEGKIASFEMEGTGGFNWGNWYIDGTGSYKGHKLRVWFKNENLVSWLDGEPKAMGPDLICILESGCFEPLSNFRPNGEHTGKKVIVYRIKAIDAWKKPKGIELFDPRHFGFDIDYTPL
jgi:DUF917 family protein